MNPFLALTAVFVISRAIYWILGMRFDASPIEINYQMVEPALLQHDLWRSLFYLREQPPGFNLFAGLVLKLWPGEPRHGFQAVYLLMGLAIPLCLFALMREMGVRERWALVASALFTVAPSTVLYENWCSYGYPFVLLFLVAPLLLIRFVVKPGVGRGLAFFGLLALIWSIHPMFHPVWFGAIAVSLMVAMWGRWRMVAVASGVPAMLILVVLAKNFVLYGDTAPGSRVLQPMGLAVMATQFTPPEVVERLKREGKITRVLQMSLYEHPPADYRDLAPEPPPTGIPLLDRPMKASGYANWNSRWMSEIGLLYKRDTMTLLREYQRGWYQNMLANVALYFFPAEDVDPFTNTRHYNRLVLDPVFRVWDYATTGQFRRRSAPWISWILLPAAVLFGAYGTWRWSGARRAAVAFMTFNILYSAALTILLIYGDHNRYRDFFSGEYAVLIVLMVQSGWEYGCSGWRAMRRG